MLSWMELSVFIVIIRYVDEQTEERFSLSAFECICMVQYGIAGCQAVARWIQ